LPGTRGGEFQNDPGYGAVAVTNCKGANFVNFWFTPCRDKLVLISENPP
jgi:hypothetical protein